MSRRAVVEWRSAPPDAQDAAALQPRDLAAWKRQRRQVEDAGYDVREASDGLAGLSVLRAAPEPMVVLLDLMMPRMSDIKLLRAVPDDPPLAARHAFILFTAARAFRAEALVFYLPGRHMFEVPKPFDLDELVATVERATQELGGKSAATSALIAAISAAPPASGVCVGHHSSADAALVLVVWRCPARRHSPIGRLDTGSMLALCEQAVGGREELHRWPCGALTNQVTHWQVPAVTNEEALRGHDSIGNTTASGREHDDGCTTDGATSGNESGNESDNESDTESGGTGRIAARYIPNQYTPQARAASRHGERQTRRAGREGEIWPGVLCPDRC